MNVKTFHTFTVIHIQLVVEIWRDIFKSEVEVRPTLLMYVKYLPQEKGMKVWREKIVKSELLRRAGLLPSLGSEYFEQSIFLK